ncbi:uncharacterized protein LOC144003783 [Festucalex cinctus]
MSPLFMDVRDEATSGSEREAPGDKRGTKRRLKNRDAARKSRKKQTERADELHQELLCLEASNSALEKEIAALNKEVRCYTAALEHHRPFCVHRRSSRVDIGEPSASAPSKVELGENPRPSPSSDFVSPCLFSLAPQSLFGGDTNTEFPHLLSSSFSTLHCEEVRSVVPGIFHVEDQGVAPLEPRAFDANYESHLGSEQADGKPSHEIPPTLESLTAPLPVPGFFPSNAPSVEGELSLSEFLAENDWLLSVAGNSDTL